MRSYSPETLTVRSGMQSISLHWFGRTVDHLGPASAASPVHVLAGRLVRTVTSRLRLDDLRHPATHGAHHPARRPPSLRCGASTALRSPPKAVPSRSTGP